MVEDGPLKDHVLLDLEESVKLSDHHIVLLPIRGGDVGGGKGILCTLSHAVQQVADLSVIVFGWHTRCKAELFKAALPPGPFVWRLEVKGRWGLQPAASHPTSDTMFKIGSWFTFADCDQD